MNRFGLVRRLIQREPVAFQGCVQATLAALAGVTPKSTVRAAAASGGPGAPGQA